MRDILNSYTTTELRKHISKFNKSLGLVKGYSKMKKADLVNLMTKKENVDKFKSIKMKPKTERKKPEKKTTTTTKTATKTTTKTQPKKQTTTTTPKEQTKKETPKKQTTTTPKEQTKKETPSSFENELITNWNKPINNTLIDQNKNLRNALNSIIENPRNETINIDGLFSLFPTNKLFEKYLPQKVIDGFKKIINYFNEENKPIGLTNFRDYFSYSKEGVVLSNIRGKKLNKRVLDKLAKDWKKDNHNPRIREKLLKTIQEGITDLKKLNKNIPTLKEVKSKKEGIKVYTMLSNKLKKLDRDYNDKFSDFLKLKMFSRTDRDTITGPYNELFNSINFKLNSNIRELEK